MLRMGTTNSMSGAFHVAFSSCWTGVEIFEYQFLRQVRTPFQESLSNCFEERRYLWIAQLLVGKFNPVCSGFGRMREQC